MILLIALSSFCNCFRLESAGEGSLDDSLLNDFLLVDIPLVFFSLESLLSLDLSLASGEELLLEDFRLSEESESFEDILLDLLALDSEFVSDSDVFDFISLSLHRQTQRWRVFRA